MSRFAIVAIIAILVAFAEGALAPSPVWMVRAAQAVTPPVATPLAEGAAEYVDPAGRFTLPVPTGWSAATVGDAAMLTSPEGGITIYALPVPGTDVPAALDEAWRLVDPGFALTPGEPVEVPAGSGIPAVTVVSYEGGSPEEAVQAIGQTAGDTVFAVLVRADLDEAARRASQLQTIAVGLEIAGVEQESLLGVDPAKLTPAMLAEVDAFFAETMARFGAPGAAYAVVQDGRIIHSAGFGVTARGGTEPVTPETLMLAGSVTKPMTTTYMAAIVDAGRLRWDEPVVEILPTFAVADPGVTPRLTMRDLVCACTGVPRRDLELLFESEDVTAAETIASLRDFIFFTAVGEAFQYSNQMVAAGGYIAAIADGGSLDTVYDDYVAGMERRLFDPIGMTATTFSFAEVERSGNYALPHALALDGSVTEVPVEMEFDVAPVAPAGGAWSNVLDLARYVITQLERGRAPDGTRVVSAENLLETWQPGVQVGPGFAYGLGWVVTDYKEQPLLYHDGGTLGYNAEVALLPEAGLGVALVANQANVLPLLEAVRTRLFEIAFAQPAAGDAGIEFVLEQQEQAFAELAALVEPLADDEARPFLGAWHHPALGEVELALRDSVLTLDAGDFASELVAARDPTTGERFYLTATPPLVGLRVTLRDESGTPSLVVHDPASMDVYVFEMAGRHDGQMVSGEATPASPAAGQ